METKLETTRVMQIGILTHNIQDTVEKWAGFLNIPVPAVSLSDGYDKTSAEYYGKPCNGKCYQAFINFATDMKSRGRSTVASRAMQGFTRLFSISIILK